MDSCIISFNLNCFVQLKQFCNVATKVSNRSRKKCYYFWWSIWLFIGIPRLWPIAEGVLQRKDSKIISATFLSILSLSTKLWLYCINAAKMTLWSIPKHTFIQKLQNSNSYSLHNKSQIVMIATQWSTQSTTASISDGTELADTHAWKIFPSQISSKLNLVLM